MVFTIARLSYIGGEILAHESANYKSVYLTSLDYPEVFWSSLAKRLLKWRGGDFETINSCDFKRGHVEWFKDGTLNASGNQRIVRFTCRLMSLMSIKYSNCFVITESCLDRHIPETKSPALIHYQADRTQTPITYTYVNLNTHMSWVCKIHFSPILPPHRELKAMTCQIANLMIQAQLKYCKGRKHVSASGSEGSNISNMAEPNAPAMVMICMPLNPLAVASMLACARIGAVH